MALKPFKKGTRPVSNKSSNASRVLFLCPDYDPANIALQPWRYIHELANGMTRYGHEVFLLTGRQPSGAEQPFTINYTVYRTKFSPGNFSTMETRLAALQADKLVWSITPSSFVYYPLFRRCGARIWGMFNYPYYSSREIARALISLPFRDVRQYLRNRLIPHAGIRFHLNGHYFRGIICQSKRNIKRLEKIGISRGKLYHIPPGLSQDEFSEETHTPPEGPFTFTYAGSVKKIRGTELLVRSFGKAVKENPGIRLLILARGADSATTRAILKLAANHCCKNNIEVRNGWLSRSEYEHCITKSHAVVLPFILVPSEMPLVALEALAKGKPVIASNLDGLPELIGGSGIITKPGNPKDLTEAMLKLCTDKDLYNRCARTALKTIDSYPSWDDIVDRFHKLLFSGGDVI